MTLSEIKALSDDELRIKVAELCGWERGPQKDIKIGSFGWASANSCWHRKGEKDNWQDNPPNFCRDLNAMYEAEKLLDDGVYWHDYLNRLWDVVCPQFEQMSGLNAAVGLLLVHATARQKAEAFALTTQEDRP